MSEYSSYFLYRKYQILNGELIDLGITSVDADGTMPLVTRNECDPACGCQTEPIYRWISVAGGYECSGTTKMAQEKEQVSNDNGETWSDVSPLTTRPALPVIAYNSEDCGYIPPTPVCKCSAYTYSFTSATVSSAATSITLSYTGCSKLDLTSAATYNWIAVGNQTYNTGTSVGNIIANISANTSSSRIAAFYLSLDGTGCNTIYISQQSGATPTFDGKYKLTLNDSSIVSAECDSTSSVTSGEVATQYSGSVVSAEVGPCVTSMNAKAFYDCSGLTSVTIPDSVTSIGNFVFDGCTSLKSATLPSGVTSIGDQAFLDCSGLTSVDIPNKVTNIGRWAFARCSSLTSVTIGTGLTIIGENVFAYCTSLTSISIPDSVTTIGRMAFSNCTGLTSVTIGSGITNTGVYAFAYCSGLTSIGPVGSGASVEIPNNITSINDSTFSSCSGLTSVTIPSSVTSIGKSVFYYCSSLTSVDIPSSVTSIGESAFNYCTSLASVTVESSIPPTLGTYAFHNTNNCPIYVPSASVNTFKSASGWSSYRSRIQAIP